jgi:hypothetical protein
MFDDVVYMKATINPSLSSCSTFRQSSSLPVRSTLAQTSSAALRLSRYTFACPHPLNPTLHASRSCADVATTAAINQGKARRPPALKSTVRVGGTVQDPRTRIWRREWRTRVERQPR